MTMGNAFRGAPGNDSSKDNITWFPQTNRRSDAPRPSPPIDALAAFVNLLGAEVIMPLYDIVCLSIRDTW